MTNHRKKLIEVALPLDAINAASAREKSIRHGHPSTLHLWWARRPLAAARAVIFAQMVDDPSAHPDLFPTEADQEKERERLFRLIEELVKWENTTNESVLERARTEIRKSWRRTCAENADHPRAGELFDPDKLPAFHDPFAGGGALPLEAQRLGLEAHASDLNPVAVLINKAMIEIPPKFAGRPPVNPEARTKYLGARAPACALHADRSRPHKSWRSRGYLPHLDQPEIIQAVTFRLADSIPADVIAAWKSELALTGAEEASDPRCVELRERIERYTEEGHGACWLRDGRVADEVEKALLHFDGVRYRLLAWVIMPNHVHALVETMPGFPLDGVIQSWKSFTAKQVNKILDRSGQFWMPDYFDRYIRNEKHLVTVVDYIEQNPVKAGLVDSASEWRWSSAARNAVGMRIGGSERDNRDNADETSAFPGLWAGAKGLAEDVRYYGQWMRDEAEKRIGHLYPKIEITAEMAAERPDLKQYQRRKLTVIAWLWARTVRSPNPAFADVEVPLASTFMLSTKKGKEAYVEPVIEGRGYRFAVKVGKPEDAEAAKAGTKLSRGANFRCLMSGTPMAGDYIKAEGKAGRMGARLMAIVAEGDRGRVYLAPTPEHEDIAAQEGPTWKPENDLVGKCRDQLPLYGMNTFADIFTPRQLVALTTFSDLVAEAMERIKRDYLGARASGPHVHPTPAHLSTPPERAWHSRGYHPHLDVAGLIQSITFRLADSVPYVLLQQWREHLRMDVENPQNHADTIALLERIAEYEDAGHGACYLRQAKIARLVQTALLHFDSERYRLLEWCIMPNHVHVLIEQLPGHRLADVVQAWKSFTAKQANRILGRSGSFWMPDYYDRFVRDDQHLAAVRRYIRDNPVKAGLCEDATEWPWSSASLTSARATGSHAGGTPAHPDDETPLRDGGDGATAYAEAVGVYLACGISRSADFWSNLCIWANQPKNELVTHLFGRQAIPMAWDYAEASPFSNSGGNFEKNLSYVAKNIDGLTGTALGFAQQVDAAANRVSADKLVSTDPPYYDNIGYADLSDYFYVWLRRSLRSTFPNLFVTLAVPKAEELVATPYRHGNKEKAETFFLAGMTDAMRRLAEQAHPGFPVSIYYAFKQSEKKGEMGTTSTGWETFLDAVIRAGFAVTGT